MHARKEREARRAGTKDTSVRDTYHLVLFIDRFGFWYFCRVIFTVQQLVWWIGHSNTILCDPSSKVGAADAFLPLSQRRGHNDLVVCVEV